MAVFSLPDKGAWRRDFIRRVALIGEQAKESLARAQYRYKRAYDAQDRLRNSRITVNDYVLVRVYADSPRLTLPLAGPYRVLKVDDRNGTYVVHTRDGSARVAGDRVRPAPIPKDLPEGVLVPLPRAETETGPENVQYVIERILSHGRDEMGTPIARVRWAGYTDADDTWEPVSALPHLVVKAYARRKRVSIDSLFT